MTDSIGRPWLVFAGLAGVFLLTIAVVPPRGDYPIDDDFDYSATALHLAEEGRLGLTDWPSMTLVAHAAWGAAFARLFGSSHEALRASTLTLAATGACALALASWRSQRSTTDAIGFGAWFFLNPLSLALAYTFMTDMPAAALTAVGIVWASGSQSIRGWAATGLLGAWGLLIRQTGGIWALAAGAFGDDRKLAWRRGVAILAPMVLAWLAWRWWLSTHGGLPWNAARWQLSSAPLLNPKLFLAKATCLGLACGLHLLPVALLRVAPGDFARPRFLGAGLVLAVLLIGARQHLRVHEGTDIRNLALVNGARLKGEEALAGPAFAGIDLFETLLLSLGVAGLVTMLAVGLAPRSGEGDDAAKRARRTAAATFVATFAVYMVVESLFDRYYLALVAPAGVWLASLPPRRSSRVMRAVALVVLATYAAAAILGMNDAQRRADVVWKTARALVMEGVPPDEINACFEFTAVKTYLPHYWGGPFPARPYLTSVPPERQSGERERRMPDRRIFLPSRKWTLSWRLLEGWIVDREIHWQAWWRSGSLYVLRKAD